jgi:hypothetical protein
MTTPPDRRRREYVPAEDSKPAAQAPTPPGEDTTLALDTLERRIAHLSILLNPPPGQRPHRTAHWRDEVELRSLRLSAKALKQYRGDDGRDKLVALVARTAERLQQLLDSGALPVRQQELAQRMVEDVDAVLEGIE